MFNIPTKDTYIDGYIDDMLTIIVALDHLLQRAIQVIPLLCFVFFGPVHKDELLERSDIISTKNY